MNRRQLGRFTITYEIMERLDQMSEFFVNLRCVPVDVKCNWHDRIMEFTVISDFFPEVPEGNIIPIYNLVIDKDHKIKLYLYNSSDSKEVDIVESILEGSI